MNTRLTNASQRRSWFLNGFLLLLIANIAGCGSSEPSPLDISSDNIATLKIGAPYQLPANTKLEATAKCVLSFPGEDLFDPGDVIGEVVDIDNDALMRIAPNNEKVSVELQSGQSVSISKARTVTVDDSAESPCRFKVFRQ